MERGHDHEAHDPDHDHDHDHGHASALTPTRQLAWALALTAGFMGVEVAFGFVSHSLALLSDAGHMLTDAGALALALAAQRVASRPRTRVHTFGFRRVEILAALVNGAVLGASAIGVVVEAVRRFRDPPVVAGGLMLVVAAVGLAVNLAAAWILSRGRTKSSNVRAALAHVVADAAGSVAAMIAGVLVRVFDWRLADPLVSIVISALILWSAWRLVRSSMLTLMETAPAGLDAQAIEDTIRATEGVASVHDLHLWTIADGFPIVTAHVVLQASAHGVDVSRRVGDRLRREHHIEHATIQPEATIDDIVPVSRLRKDRPPELKS
jgi:cobalt-zinc-cadmium efflux system protein